MRRPASISITGNISSAISMVDRPLDELGAGGADISEELGDEQRAGLLDLLARAVAGDANLPFEHRRDQHHRVVGSQQRDGHDQVGADQPEHRQTVQAVLQYQAAPGSEKVRERRGSHRRMKGLGVVRPRRLSNPAQYARCSA